MDKQKQIEEMEKDIAVRMAMAKSVAGSMNNGVEGWVGKYLIERGWAKKPENAVVLTREEYDELQKGVKPYNYTAMFDAQSAYRLEQGYLLGRKETAEKFALKLADYFVEHCGDKLFIGLTLQEWYKMIDEICKEITGEN